MIKDLGKVGLIRGFEGSEQDILNNFVFSRGNPNLKNVVSSYGTFCIDVLSADIYVNTDNNQNWRLKSEDAYSSVAGKWIDGRIIYRNIISFTNASLIGGNTLVHNLSIGSYLKETFILPSGNTDVPRVLSSSELLSLGFASSYSATQQQIIINFSNSTNFNGGGTWYYIVEYVKDIEVSETQDYFINIGALSNYESPGYVLTSAMFTSSFSNSQGNPAYVVHIKKPFSQGDIYFNGSLIDLKTPILISDINLGKLIWYPIPVDLHTPTEFTLSFETLSVTVGSSSNESVLHINYTSNPII